MENDPPPEPFTEVSPAGERLFALCGNSLNVTAALPTTIIANHVLGHAGRGGTLSLYAFG
jgi:hypothetical protein